MLVFRPARGIFWVLALLALSLLLLTPAFAGYYEGPIFSGGTSSDGTAYQTIGNNGYYGYAFGPKADVLPNPWFGTPPLGTTSSSFSGQLTAKFIWHPDNPNDIAPCTTIEEVSFASGDISCWDDSYLYIPAAIPGNAVSLSNGIGSPVTSMSHTATGGFQDFVSNLFKDCRGARHRNVGPNANGEIIVQCSPSASCNYSNDQYHFSWEGGCSVEYHVFLYYAQIHVNSGHINVTPNKPIALAGDQIYAYVTVNNQYAEGAFSSAVWSINPDDQSCFRKYPIIRLTLIERRVTMDGIATKIMKKPTGALTVLLVTTGIIGTVTPLYAQSTGTPPSGINKIISGSTNEIIDDGVPSGVEEKRKQADAFEKKGDALLEQGKVDEAMTKYRQAMAADPGFGNAYAKLGKILFDQGNYKESAVTYKQLFYSEEDKAWGGGRGGGIDDIARMAIAFSRIGDRATAMGAYGLLFKIMSPSSNAKCPMTQVPYLAHFDDSIPQLAYTPERLEAAALTIVGVDCYQPHDGTKCYAVLRQAIALWPQYAVAQFYLANKLCNFYMLSDLNTPNRQDRIDEAANALQAALRYGDLDVRAGVRQLAKDYGLKGF